MEINMASRQSNIPVKQYTSTVQVFRECQISKSPRNYGHKLRPLGYNLKFLKKIDKTIFSYTK